MTEFGGVTMDRVDLQSPATYAESCLRIADRNFAGLTAAEVEAAAPEYNAYPGLEELRPPQNIIRLEDRLDEKMRQAARRAVLEGRIFWEHTAAGEATRLKLGPKYLIHPHSLEGRVEADLEPLNLLPLTLGSRHLLQWVFEIRRLAEESGEDPQKVLSRQKTLLVVNEDIRAEVLMRLREADFLGLNPDAFFFLVQPAFHGLTPGPQGWRFNEDTPKRLHNHGHMAMLKTMDRQVFHLDRDGREHSLSQEDFFRRLGEADDLLSYNIEDLGYLTRALDFDTIGLALHLGSEGYGMTMEIVGNNPQAPITGGLCAFDPALGRDVVIEGFRLKGLPPEKIHHLNKNFNHYPQPALAFKKLHEEGLFMPVAVKDGALYFQPVQGDMNFLVKTAFIGRRVPAPIHSWKSGLDTPAALRAMAEQDSQPGFRDFALNYCQEH